MIDGYQNINDPNSYAKIEVKQGKKKKQKGIKKLDQVTVKDENFNIYGLGEIKYAKLHGEANRPLYQNREELDYSLIQKCPCCNFPAPDEKGQYLRFFSTGDDPDSFSNCGQGVVLYYSFIKYVIVSLLIVAVGISCFNIYFNFKYYKELQKVCNDLSNNEVYKNAVSDICELYVSEADDYVDSTFFQFSSVNIKDYRKLFMKITSEDNKSFESPIINISRINFCCIVFVFVFNLAFIYFLFNKSNAADYLVFTVSDYSVFLYNLYDAHNIFLEQNKASSGNIGDSMQGSSELDQFKDFLKNNVCKGNYDENFNINRIDFCYKLEKLAKLQKKYEHCLELISEIEYDPKVKKQNKKDGLEEDNRKYISSGCCSKDAKTLGEIKKERDEYEKQINELIDDSRKNTSNYFGGAALITFDSIKEQELYLKNLPHNSFEYFFQFLKNAAYHLCCCCFNKNDNKYIKRNIKFEAAPEPEDIIFENLETTSFARTMRTVLVYIISIIICGVSFAIIVALNYVQVSKLDKSDNNDLLLYILSLVITAVTSAIDIVLEIVLKILTEIEKQATKTDFFLSYSVKLTLFTFLNSALLPLFSEYIVDETDAGYKILISNMVMKFLVNAFVTPIMWTINFGFFWKKIQIFFIERKIKNEENLSEEEKTFDKNQKELNELYELPPMNVELKYSYIFKTLLMSFLYIPIFPLGVLISLVGFILGYWLEKFNFANMYKRPEMLNRQIAEFYVKNFIVLLFVYGIGDYIFLSDAYETRIWSLLNIILFGILIIIPYHQVLSIDSLEIEESSIHNKKYDEAYVGFYIDYERANPMTQKEGKLRYLQTLNSKGLINKEDYEKNMFNIKNANPMNMFYNRRGRGYGGGFNSQNTGFYGPWNNFGPQGPFGFYSPYGPNFNYPPSNQNYNSNQTNQQNNLNSNLTIKQNNAYNSDNQVPPSSTTTINYQPSQGFSGGNMGPNNNFTPSSQGFSGGNMGPNNNYTPSSQGFSGGNMGPNNNFNPSSSQRYTGGNNFMPPSFQGYPGGNRGGPGQFQNQYPPNNSFVPANNF